MNRRLGAMMLLSVATPAALACGGGSIGAPSGTEGWTAAGIYMGVTALLSVALLRVAPKQQAGWRWHQRLGTTVLFLAQLLAALICAYWGASALEHMQMMRGLMKEGVAFRMASPEELAGAALLLIVGAGGLVLHYQLLRHTQRAWWLGLAIWAALLAWSLQNGYYVLIIIMAFLFTSIARSLYALWPRINPFLRREKAEGAIAAETAP